MAIKKNNGKVKKILLISLSNLGDIVLTTPVFMCLARNFPSAKIDVMTGISAKSIFQKHPSTGTVFVHKGKKTFFLRVLELLDLRSRKYDVVVDLKNSLLPVFLGARISSPVRRITDAGTPHKSEEHLNKLRCMGIDTASAEFYIPVTEEEAKKVDELVRSAGGRKIVVVNPGSKSHLKRWSAKNYAQLSDRLTKELGCAVFVAGSEEDKAANDAVIREIKERVHDITANTTVGELAGLMSRSQLVVTNDSAPLHIASAVNAPCVAIFGPSNDKKYGPLSRRSCVITTDAVCRPCETALCKIAPAQGCINTITVEKVFEASKKLLS